MKDKENKTIKIKLKARLQAYTYGAIPTRISHLENDIPLLALDRVMAELTEEQRLFGRASLGVYSFADMTRLITIIPITSSMWGSEGCTIGIEKHSLRSLYGISVECFSLTGEGEWESLNEDIYLDNTNTTITIRSVLPWVGYVQIAAPIESAIIPDGELDFIHDDSGGELLTA